MGSRGQSSRKGFTSAQKAKADNIKRQAEKRGYTDIKFKRNKDGEVEYSYTEKKNVQFVHGGKMISPDKNDLYERTIIHSGKIGKDGLIKRNKDEKTDVLLQRGRAPKIERNEGTPTRDRQAGNIPAGIRVTFPDGRTQVYAQGPNDRVMDERGLPRDVQGIRYSDLYNRMVSNQANSGVTFERITGEELSAMQAAHREERANRPDYEFGIGTPWGNSENRRAARVSRRIGRGQRR